ncbi:hypothetical protein EC9_06700 [Rosistilla ulvae]|uniref:Uncharacterized protein n=1 Tax=Rosistilla ulvae TaxID=1930277 RepID=A0A517LV62_9BACT|nr:hypothetical protein [Rosistilla ulvae]QDS86506.1 hypothetical protein EC9_06700 [Rosistilla ulvae]
MNLGNDSTPLATRPICSDLTVVAIVGLGMVILLMGFIAGAIVNRGPESWFIFVFVGTLVSWNATVATCCLAKGPRLPLRLVLLVATILFSTATSSVLGRDTIQSFAPFFLSTAMLAWLLSFAAGFPAWRLANDPDPATRSQYSISGLLILTTFLAVLFTLFKQLAPTQRDLTAMTILGVGGTAGWLLGCSSFCHRTHRWPLATLALLALLCLTFWTLMTNYDFGQPGGDTFEVCFVYPAASYSIPAIIGRIPQRSPTPIDEALAIDA